MAMYLRLTGGTDLQVPIRRFAHPGTGREITVVGVLHIGEEAYFLQLRTFIDALTTAGAVVHVERSGRVPGDDVGSTAEELAVLADMDRAAALDRRRAEELGWTSQVDGLGYPPHWQRHDVPGLQVLRRVGVPAMRRFAARKLRAVDWLDTDATALERYRARIAFGLHFTVGNNDGVLRALGRDPVLAVAVHERTAHALEQALGTQENLVLVWGVMHQPGFVAGLAEHGFEEVGEPEWRTALQLPSFGASLWRLAIGALRRPRSSRRTPVAAEQVGRST